MMTESTTEQPTHDPDPQTAYRKEEPPPELDTPDALRAFLYDSFVRYNPIYLLSAALVLAGLTLLLVDVASDDAIGGLGVGALGELYALCLIGGAALLARIGQRRAGVMVGLLAALYQCDLTMNAERAVFLGAAGVVGMLVWTALFHLKLRLLARALELTPSRSALWVPTLGAALLGWLPQTHYLLAPGQRTQLTALAIFVVGALALWTHREIESAVGYDYRGRRAIRGTWLMWAGGGLLHVAYWGAELGVSLLGLAPAFVLLSTRWATREASVWKLCVSVALAVAALDSGALSPTLLMIGATLLLRAFRKASQVEAPRQAEQAPYRHPTDAAEPAAALTTLVFRRAEAREFGRLALGAMVVAHLAAWTHVGPFQARMPHVLWADLALLAACCVALYRTRHWQYATPPLVLGIHFAIEREWLVAPSSAAQTGGWAVGTGFVLLGGSLALAWWRRERGGADPAPPPDPSAGAVMSSATTHSACGPLGPS